MLPPSCFATLQKVMGPKYGTTPKKDLYQLMQVFNPRMMRKQEIVIIQTHLGIGILQEIEPMLRDFLEFQTAAQN